MKILHLPIDVAGQSIITKKGLNILGYKADCLSPKHRFEYETDLVLGKYSKNILKQISKLVFLFKSLIRYNVFHYHSKSLFSNKLDIKILKLFRKKIFIEFWGSEIRLYDIEKKRNRFFVLDNVPNNNSKRKLLEFWSSVTDNVIVSDHSMDAFLKPYFKNICVVGQRIEIDKYEIYYPNENTKIPKIVHAPSSKSTKGTKYITEAIETLRNDGLSFEYIEVSDISHEEALEEYKKADIVIDQLLIGSYGILACECMAFGKPVICYILEENVAKYGTDLPIVNANPDTIKDVLKELVKSPEMRERIGRKSRAYAEKKHDYREVAKRLVKIYAEN